LYRAPAAKQSLCRIDYFDVLEFRVFLFLTAPTGKKSTVTAAKKSVGTIGIMFI